MSRPRPRRRLALDDDLAEAHAALAYAKFYTWDWAGAEAGFKRALELNPNSAWALDGYNWGYLTQIRGQYDEALAGMRRAREVDPLSGLLVRDVGWVLYHAGRYDAAIEQFQQAVAMIPSNPWAYMGIGPAYVALGRFDEAIPWFQKGVDVSGGDSTAKARLGWAYGRAGRRTRRSAILDELTRRYPQEKFSPMTFVFVYQGPRRSGQRIPVAGAWLRDTGLLIWRSCRAASSRTCGAIPATRP